MSTPETGYPVAYCAPGKRYIAALTLMFKGEQVARIVEHAWMAGRDEVVVVGEDPEILAGPEAFRMTPAAGGRDSDKETGDD